MQNSQLGTGWPTPVQRLAHGNGELSRKPDCVLGTVRAVTGVQEPLVHVENWRCEDSAPVPLPARTSIRGSVHFLTTVRLAVARARQTAKTSKSVGFSLPLVLFSSIS